MDLKFVLFFYFLGVFSYILFSRFLQYVYVVKLVGVINYHSLLLVKHMEMIYKRYEVSVLPLHHLYFGKYVECYGTRELGYTYNGFWFPPEIVSERG